MTKSTTTPPGGPTEGSVFLTHLLQEGDILLCTDPDSRISNLIQTASGGVFSHAALCTCPPNFIEATFTGVAEISLARFGLHRRACGKMLRLKPELANRDAIRTIAVKQAYRYRTREYDKIAALASLFPNWELDPGTRMFCSYLVAAAYALAGLNITAPRKPPRKTTPADIDASPLFDDMTDSVLAHAQFLPGTPRYFVDEGYTDSPPQEYNIALRIATERVSAFLEKHGEPPLDDYPSALGIYFQYRSKPWFGEFDMLFGSSIDELGEPALARTEKLVAEARGHDAGTLVLRIRSCSVDTYPIMLALVANRIKTSGALIAERQRDITACQAGAAAGLHTAAILLDHARRIHAGLSGNLDMYRREQAFFLAHPPF
ncbi:YiiX/YebB-like N1pC/P60 family cysteine hydrolase [Massilia scottii]|uniref:YiiX/YebB-like N1pC/P60 family cysteine hydrolase n=1 Tax=Massilia scottii TaxID=3057166 RepID=UPI0027968A75|nr:YiiX/YebB-like N1pC/P60 family cysteine hydrolase [Massilia sp. CCM 9029]MDQ1831828.1 YiiX/YebB-like N1pC/P60 family cysteine hydrolase [Massilia sp. CCM 9029]